MGCVSVTAFYNEIDAYAAQWLRNLISEGLIAKGDVDERSISDVKPEDKQLTDAGKADLERLERIKSKNLK